MVAKAQPLPITELDLDVVRSRFCLSGYSNVYAIQKPSGTFYFGRVRSNHEAYYLGCRHRARDVAKLVIYWWRQRYGDQWERAFRSRKSDTQKRRGSVKPARLK